MLVESFEHSGMTVEIHHDESCESPRNDCNLGTMVCNHRRYNLGDVKGNADDIPEGAIVLPLYLYDHSGITMNTTGFSCPWDSGQVGAIYCSREDALKEYSSKRMTKKIRQKVIEQLQNEVEVYDKFIRGECYGYIVKDDEENHLDSCWGFIGMEYVTEEAKRQAEYCSKSSVSYAI